MVDAYLCIKYESSISKGSKDFKWNPIWRPVTVFDFHFQHFTSCDYSYVWWLWWPCWIWRLWLKLCKCYSLITISELAASSHVVVFWQFSIFRMLDANVHAKSAGCNWRGSKVMTKHQNSIMTVGSHIQFFCTFWPLGLFTYGAAMSGPNLVYGQQTKCKLALAASSHLWFLFFGLLTIRPCKYGRCLCPCQI